jgi:transposase
VSRQQKPSRQVSVDEQIQVVLAVLKGELSLAEAARRHGVSSATVGNWRDRFVDAGKAGMDRSLPGPDGGQSQTERRLRHECEQLKLALAEATVQLRIWQKGSAFVDAVPSPTSRPESGTWRVGLEVRSTRWDPRTNLLAATSPPVRWTPSWWATCWGRCGSWPRTA